MAWKRSAFSKAERVAEASSKKLKTNRSVQKISGAPVYRIYRLSYNIGKYALKWMGLVAKGLGNLCRLTLPDAFGKVINFARSLTELKRSRFIRGEFSITRSIFIVTRKILRACEVIFRSFYSRGSLYGFKVAGTMFKGALSEFSSKNRKVFNYLAPVAGMAVLGLTIYFWSSARIAVSVSYNNKMLGVIASEQVYKDAANNVETNVSEASGSSFALQKEPIYKLELSSKSNLLSEDELYDNILSASSQDLSSSYGLYVGNDLVGANDNNTAIQTMLDNIKKPYEADVNNEQVEFYQNVAIKKGVFPKSVERTTDNMKAILTGSARNSVTYTAQKGDSTAMVANKFNVSVNQIYAMNTSVQADGLTQGETIQIVDPQPTLQVQYTKRETSTQSIPFQTVMSQSTSKAKGSVTVTQQGQPGVMQIVSDVTYLGNAVVDSKAISTTMLKAPVNLYKTVGTYVYSGNSSSINDYAGDFSGQSSSIIDYAEKFLGERYVGDGSSPGGFDCSGFTMYVFSKFGIELPHSAAAQSGYGASVSRNNLQPGDLIFFDTTGGISHVGIYLDNGQFINAENYSVGVTIDSLDTAYWSRCYVTAKKILQ
jgi:cell wall-associated NlpC family hydrolase